MQLPFERLEFDDIQLNTYGFHNRRTVQTDISELKASIIENGLMTPLMVWEAKPDEYVLINGYRRYAAIESIREETDNVFDGVTCSIFQGTLDEAQALNLIENIEREDFNKADETEGIALLYKQIGDQTKVGFLLSKSQGWVSQRVNLYKNLIPKGLELLRQGKVNLTTAKKISALLDKDGNPDLVGQQAIIDKILADGEDNTKIKTDKVRERTYRTKDEFVKLETLAETADTIDQLHKATVLRVLAWYKKQIGEEELLFEPIALASDEEADASEEELDAAIDASGLSHDSSGTEEEEGTADASPEAEEDADLADKPVRRAKRAPQTEMPAASAPTTIGKRLRKAAAEE